MLDYKKIEHLRCYGGYETYQDVTKAYILAEFEKRTDRLKEKEKALEEIAYEKYLVENDIVNVIKEDVGMSSINLFNGFTPKLLHNAYLHGNGHKYDEDTEQDLKDRENSFNYVDLLIRRWFFLDNKDYKFAGEVIDWNFSTSYNFAYTIRGHKVWACIPNFAGVNEKNWREIMGGGYVVRYMESENTIGWIVSDMDYKKIGPALKEWVDEHWPKRKRKGEKKDEL